MSHRLAIVSRTTQTVAWVYEDGVVLPHITAHIYIEWFVLPHNLQVLAQRKCARWSSHTVEIQASPPAMSRQVVSWGGMVTASVLSKIYINLWIE